MKTPPLTSQMEINGFKVDISQLSETIKNMICYEPPLSPLNFCAHEKCFMDCCPDTRISYLLRPSFVTPAGAGEDKPLLALTPCSLLQPLPHPAPGLGTHRVSEDLGKGNSVSSHEAGERGKVHEDRCARPEGSWDGGKAGEVSGGP